MIWMWPHLFLWFSSERTSILHLAWTILHGFPQDFIDHMQLTYNPERQNVAVNVHCV